MSPQQLIEDDKKVYGARPGQNGPELQGPMHDGVAAMSAEPGRQSACTAESRSRVPAAGGSRLVAGQQRRVELAHRVPNRQCGQSTAGHSAPGRRGSSSSRPQSQPCTARASRCSCCASPTVGAPVPASDGSLQVPLASLLRSDAQQLPASPQGFRMQASPRPLVAVAR